MLYSAAAFGSTKMAKAPKLLFAWFSGDKRSFASFPSPGNGALSQVTMQCFIANTSHGSCSEKTSWQLNSDKKTHGFAFSRTFFLHAHCLLFTLGDFPARLVGFVLFLFFFYNSKVFYLYFNLSPSFVNIWSYLKELQSKVRRKQTLLPESKHQLFNHLGQKTLGRVWNRNGRKTLSSRQHCVVA